MGSHCFRTRFAGDIVAEYLPARGRSSRVLIFCMGVPTMPTKAALLQTYARLGYWVFLPRYRGTWESGGSFLRQSPEEDILDVIEGLPRGFAVYGTRNVHRLRPSSIYVAGSSFGGTSAILLSGHPSVTKSYALSPVVDWRVPSNAEPLTSMASYVRNAFGEAYRFRNSDWSRLGQKQFYNPVALTNKVDGSKLGIVHAKDDPVVEWRPVATFAKNTQATLTLLRRGGHFGISDLLGHAHLRRLQRFIGSST